MTRPRHSIKDIGPTAFEIWLDGAPLMAFTGRPAAELREKIRALIAQAEAQLPEDMRHLPLDMALEWLHAGAWYSTAQLQAQDPAAEVALPMVDSKVHP